MSFMALSLAGGRCVTAGTCGEIETPGVQAVTSSLLVGAVIAMITNDGLLGLLVIIGAFFGLLTYQFVRAVP
jgi:hypothetical protein